MRLSKRQGRQRSLPWSSGSGGGGSAHLKWDSDREEGEPRKPVKVSGQQQNGETQETSSSWWTKDTKKPVKVENRKTGKVS